MDFGQIGSIVGTAAIVATAVATGTSTAVTLWWRRKDRAEADFAFTNRQAIRPTGEYGVTDLRLRFDCRLLNAGDGTAFRLTVSGEHCQVGLYTTMQSGILGMDRVSHDLIAAFPPGDDIFLLARCEDAAWENAEIVIEWTASPTREKKRVRHVEPLRELFDLPEPPDQQSA